MKIWWQDMRWSYGYYRAMGGSPMASGLSTAFDQLVQWINQARCYVTDHAWEGHGWAGTESGGDGAHCLRCGYSWDVVFY